VVTALAFLDPCYIIFSKTLFEMTSTKDLPSRQIEDTAPTSTGEIPVQKALMAMREWQKATLPYTSSHIYTISHI